MCGRYTLFTPPDELAERFEVEPPSFDPSYNCAPGQDLPVVTQSGTDLKRWGFVPEWAEDDRASINARGESLAETRRFADAVERRRCLVPADGFYEWVERDGEKRPYRVAFEDDRVFAMAGIWSRWEPPDRQAGLGEFDDGTPSRTPDAVETFAVVTTEPNDLVADLHHRMAVVLDPTEESTWLRGSTAAAQSLVDPFPDDDLAAHPVSTRVNDPGVDDPTLVERVDA